jgi:hypothetical protein
MLTRRMLIQENPDIREMLIQRNPDTREILTPEKS